MGNNPDCSRIINGMSNSMSGNSIPTIVVVDDSPAVKILFERSIQDLQVELVVFDSAKTSWSYLQTNQPDLLFLNIKMPGKDGLIYLKEIRQLPLHKTTPVVMISSKDYAQDRTIAGQLGAVDFITKPMPIKTVTEIVQKYINSSTTN